MSKKRDKFEQYIEEATSGENFFGDKVSMDFAWCVWNKAWETKPDTNELVDALEIRGIGALLHRKWEAPNNFPSRIDCFWAEDQLPFEIEIPSQLRNLMVQLQNDLVDALSKYKKGEGV